MRYLLTAEVAKRFRVHPKSVPRYVKRGILRPPVKLTPTGPNLFPEHQIEEDEAALAAVANAKAAVNAA